MVNFPSSFFHQKVRLRACIQLLLFSYFLLRFTFSLFPISICSVEDNAKPLAVVGKTLAPIPACREDFSRMKLTSFDKLLERTCSSIKNVRLCSEPDQRHGGPTANSGVAPDAA